MIKIYIKNSAEIEGLNSLQIKEITTKLTIPNPAFNMRMDQGLSTWGIASHLIYVKKLGGNTLEIPLGALSEILPLLATEQIELVEKRTYNTSTYFDDKSLKITLRDYQVEAVNKLYDTTISCLEAKTGAGKTACISALILKRKVNTLIFVHTAELAKQTIEAISKNTSIPLEDIGFIGSGKFIIKPVTVAMHQSFTKLTDDNIAMINSVFSQVLADEVHICPAKTFYQNISKLSAKYKHGFSGTLVGRSDGLDKVIHFCAGPVVHKVDSKDLDNILVKPSLKVIKTDYNYQLFSTEEYQALLTDLSQDVARNELIVKTVLADYSDFYGCFLCVRVEQVSILQKLLGASAVILTSKMSKKERQESMDKIKNKTARWVISTYGLFSTGIDIPHLNLLVLAAPIKSRIKLKQSAGRIMRLAANKTTAVILDFEDIKIDLLKYQSRTRKKVLTTL